MIKRIINPNVCVKIIFLELHNYIIYINLAKLLFQNWRIFFVRMFVLSMNFVLPTILDKLKIMLLKHRTSGIFSYLIARFLE